MKSIKYLFTALLALFFSTLINCNTSSQLENVAEDFLRAFAFSSSVEKQTTKTYLSLKGQLKDDKGKPLANALMSLNASGISSNQQRANTRAGTPSIRCTDYDLKRGNAQCFKIIKPDLFTKKSVDGCYEIYYGNSENHKAKLIAKIKKVLPGQNIQYYFSGSLPDNITHFKVHSCSNELLAEEVIGDTSSGTITDSNGNYSVKLELGQLSAITVKTPTTDHGEMKVDLTAKTTGESVEEIKSNPSKLPITTPTTLQTTVEVSVVSETVSTSSNGTTASSTNSSSTTETVSTNTGGSIDVTTLVGTATTEIATSTTVTNTTVTNTTVTNTTVTNTTVTLPSVTYSSNSYTFTKDLLISTITPTITGTITSCSISPVLPTGLSLDSATCAISGTPTAIGTTSHTITTSNSAGSTTANISITINQQTYSIGGTVSGLTGTVVLQNNSGDNKSITANGAFTFTTAVASGGAYSVTVLTQPGGQTCSVSSGSGTTSANVTGVTINCSTNTYTIGGTVSGLTGTVVLQNNSGDNKSITANGAFTFTTVVASGGAYSVTVLTQPGSQTCSVSSGSGTASANVTGVTINCSTNTYTIGGTVSGLTASGLVLQNNAGNNLSVAANATSFTFSTGLATAASYAVTVQTQPTGQTCIVASGSGTVASANVNNVSITCANGGTGTVLWARTATAGNGLSIFYGLALDSIGNPHVVGNIYGNTGNFDFGTGVVNSNNASASLVSIKYDTSGTALWTRTVSGGSVASQSSAAAVDNNGNLFTGISIAGSGTFNLGSNPITGYCSNTHGIAKYDSSGTNLWTASWATGAGCTNVGSFNGYTGAVTDSLGNVYLSGGTGGLGYTYDFGNLVQLTNSALNNGFPILIKYNASGTPVWVRGASTMPSQSVFTKITTDSANNIYTGGWIVTNATYTFSGVNVNGAYAANSNAIILKYDSNGNVVWIRTPSTAPDWSQFYGFAADSSGNIYAVGLINGNGVFTFGGVNVNGNNTTGNAVIVKYDTNGNVLWAKSTQTATTASAFNSVSVDAAGNAYAVGYINNTASFTFGGVNVAGLSAAGNNALIVKYNSSGVVQYAKTATAASGQSEFLDVKTNAFGNTYAVGQIYLNGSFNFGSGAFNGPAANWNPVIVKYE